MRLSVQNGGRYLAALMVASMLLWSLSLVLAGEADATTGQETTSQSPDGGDQHHEGDYDDGRCTPSDDGKKTGSGKDDCDHDGGGDDCPAQIQGGDHDDDCDPDDPDCPVQLQTGGGDHDDCDPDDPDCPVQLQTGGGDHDDCDGDDDDCPVELQTSGGDHDDCDEDDDDCPVELQTSGGDHDDCDEDDDDCPVELQTGDDDHDDGKDDCDNETTTTTTIAGSSSTTAPVTTPTTLDIAAAGAECRNDIPYLGYDIDWAGGGTATITFINPTGPDIVHENVPLSGEVLWPGASDDPPDWPGWILENGVWEEGDDGYLWARGTMQVRFEVNPTAVVQVSYPPANVACAGPQNAPRPTVPDTVGGVVITPPPPPGDDVGGVSELPFTGVDTGPLAAMAFGALALGSLLVVAGRRDEIEET